MRAISCEGNALAPNSARTNGGGPERSRNTVVSIENCDRRPNVDRVDRSCDSLDGLVNRATCIANFNWRDWCDEGNRRVRR